MIGGDILGGNSPDQPEVDSVLVDALKLTPQTEAGRQRADQLKFLADNGYGEIDAVRTAFTFPSDANITIAKMEDRGGNEIVVCGSFQEAQQIFEVDYPDASGWIGESMREE